MEETLIINELIAKTADIDLADLPMSIRLYNCLRRGGYATLTDVMIEAPDKFSQIRNFGKTSEQELMTIVMILNWKVLVRLYLLGSGMIMD